MKRLVKARLVVMTTLSQIQDLGQPEVPQIVGEASIASTSHRLESTCASNNPLVELAREE